MGRVWRAVFGFLIVGLLSAQAVPAQSVTRTWFTANDHAVVQRHAAYLDMDPAEFVGASVSVHHFLLGVAGKLADPSGGCSLDLAGTVEWLEYPDFVVEITPDSEAQDVVGTYYCLSSQQAARVSTTLLVFLVGVDASQRGNPLPTLAPPAIPTAEDLGVAFDPTGRPYDVSTTWGWQNRTVSTEAIGTLQIPEGKLVVMDGIAVAVNPVYFASEGVTVDFAATELELHAIRETDSDGNRGILGVRVQMPNSSVATWGDFEFAYGTDGGLGGIISSTVLDTPVYRGDDDMLFDMFFTESYLGDHDGADGTDTFVFSNGFGDGSFPMTRGRATDGDTVALIIWDIRHPWRLAIPDGTPPVDVAIREDQFLECLAGTRLLDQWGNCSVN